MITNYLKTAFRSLKKNIHFTVINILGLALGLSVCLLIVFYVLDELGIRKILGASILSLVILLSKDFLKWIAIALVIALPAGWLIMQQWLQDFAYRKTIQWWVCYRQRWHTTYCIYYHQYAIAQSCHD
ncbi:hypothetical protein A4H97_12655 [Niastella yeongjuensis]|uniref:Uncharacterized protein n=1 Tax=Niastella yeongjuensis TaxID=354355 RepID=A0A1V9EA77_9BACT|nr:hypothetical protein [Niastella yeongjuensis]OQP42992.1 hypothetical protein A4H97_12655 [Niastella yeongjuensis]SEO62430.1 hypothetical protein SAMN05660816_03199 [Niastella yeongjuensis]